jgi:hypothetical protein
MRNWFLKREHSQRYVTDEKSNLSLFWPLCSAWLSQTASNSVLLALNGVNHSAASNPKICHPFGWPQIGQ